MDERSLTLVIYSFSFLLVLYLQIMAPKISRKNIFLGVKLPEDKMASRELREIYEDYRRKNLVLGLPALLVLLGINYRYFDHRVLLVFLPLAYLLLLFMIYLAANRRVKRLKEEKNWQALADNRRLLDLDYSREREGRDWILGWGLLPIIILALNIALSLYLYPSLGDQVPNHWT